MLPGIFEKIKHISKDKKLTKREVCLCVLANRLYGNFIISKEKLESDLIPYIHDYETSYFFELGKFIRSLLLQEKYYSKQIYNAMNRLFAFYSLYRLTEQARETFLEIPLIMSESDFNNFKEKKEIDLSDFNAERYKKRSFAIYPETKGLDLFGSYSDNLETIFYDRFEPIEKITEQDLFEINTSKQEIIEGLKFYRNRDFIIDLITEQNDLADALTSIKSKDCYFYSKDIERINTQLKFMFDNYKKHSKSLNIETLKVLNPLPKTIEKIKESDALYVKQTFFEHEKKKNKIDYLLSCTKLSTLNWQNINIYFKDCEC